MESSSLLVFHHPRPSWPTHLLIVPKRVVPTLPDLVDRGLSPLLDEVAEAARQIIQGAVPERSWTLCANGGARQEVRQIHFHLTPDEQLVSDPGEAKGSSLPAHPETEAFHHPNPDWEVHLVVRGKHAPGLAALALTALDLIRRFALGPRGYTLVIDPLTGAPHCLHLIAGPRTRPHSRSEQG